MSDIAMTATILDFVHARRIRQTKDEIREKMECALKKAADILSASDEEIDAMFESLSPEYREYVETGDDTALRERAIEAGFDESDYADMADMAVTLVNLAATKNPAMAGF